MKNSYSSPVRPIYAPGRILSCCMLILFCLLALLLPINTAYGFKVYMPYPSSNSTLINPFGAEDESATLLKIIQEYYKSFTGFNSTIKSIPGRGGATAWGLLTEMEADGYTASVSYLPNFLMHSLSSYPAYKTYDLTHLAIIAEMPLVLWVTNNSPLKNLDDLINQARQKPGLFVLAGSGSYSITHITTLRFNRAAGIKALHLPYLGTQAAIHAANVKQADAVWGYPDIHSKLYKNMRPLAVAMPKRHPLLPDIPTFYELGYDLEAFVQFGIIVPATTPSEIIHQAGTVFYNIAKSPDLQEKLFQAGFTPTPVRGIDVMRTMPEFIKEYREMMEDLSMR